MIDDDHRRDARGPAGPAPQAVPDAVPGRAADAVPQPPPDGLAGKDAWRRRLLRARRERGPAERAAAAEALARQALALPELARAGTVAGYVSVGGEPGTGPLLDALRERGSTVLLPLLLPDNDLDWARYEGAEALEDGPRGLREVVGPRLGPEAVLTADVVLLPGLAVDAGGLRLGRGGGSYDRVLARIAAAPGEGPPLAVLLYPEEVVDRLPSEPHDRPVHAAVTPEGVHRFRA